MATITFYPIGDADTTLIRLADSRLILVDYADMRDPEDRTDRRCNLPLELRRVLSDAKQKDFEVVCFSHLDKDHVKGAQEFFWFEHSGTYQGDDRYKIKELWVPAVAITETGVEDDARVIREEAKHRLKTGKGIKVFSRPDALKDFLSKNNLTTKDRADCIVDAGNTVPGFSLDGPAAAEFFVHCPFGWRVNERDVEDRNQDSIVFQATFREGGEDSYAFFCSDIDSETLSMIVQTTKRHNREARLLWDVLKVPHHCSYKALDKDNKGKDETIPIPDVKWFIENQGRDASIAFSPSRPIPVKGTEEDRDPQPPHRQAASYYQRIMNNKDGVFKVAMEPTSVAHPKPYTVEIGRTGVREKVEVFSGPAFAANNPQRVG